MSDIPCHIVKVLHLVHYVIDCLYFTEQGGMMSMICTSSQSHWLPEAYEVLPHFIICIFQSHTDQ